SWWTSATELTGGLSGCHGRLWAENFEAEAADKACTFATCGRQAERLGESDGRQTQKEQMERRVEHGEMRLQLQAGGMTRETAFLIIGLITYFIGLAFTFACTFLDIFEGNNIVLLVDAGCMILAGISGLIAASIARTVTHSDKLGWSLLCALISGAFLILTVFTGGRGGRAAEAPATTSLSSSSRTIKTRQ
uniref:DUF4203 domain-containing protein n=1 Tax=Macrostomum lignano TaxID=282301 RepID=A0A1I8F3Q9_9PLAT